MSAAVGSASVTLLTGLFRESIALLPGTTSVGIAAKTAQTHTREMTASHASNRLVFVSITFI